LPADAKAELFRPGGNAGVEGLPRPTAGTWGVTPAFAQREHLEAAPPGAAPRPIAEGPAFRPVSAETAGRREAPILVPHAAVAPSFRGGVEAPRLPGEPVRNGVPEARPAMPGVAAPRGLPPLAAAPPARGEAARPAFQPAAPRMEAAPGEPRAAAPRTEAPRLEAPQIQAPRMEAPRPAEAPRVEAPRVQAPRMEAPRPAEAPRVEATRVQAPRIEAPRVEAPRVQAPRMEAPRVEARPAAPRGGDARGTVRRPPQ